MSRRNQTIKRPAGRSAFQFSMTSTFTWSDGHSRHRSLILFSLRLMNATVLSPRWCFSYHHASARAKVPGAVERSARIRVASPAVSFAAAWITARCACWHHWLDRVPHLVGCWQHALDSRRWIWLARSCSRSCHRCFVHVAGPRYCSTGTGVFGVI